MIYCKDCQSETVASNGLVVRCTAYSECGRYTMVPTKSRRKRRSK